MMMMLLQITSVILALTASALAVRANEIVPNLLQIILDDVLNDPLERESQVESLMQLSRGLNQAYNLIYQVKDPVGDGGFEGSQKISSLMVEENTYEPDPYEDVLKGQAIGFYMNPKPKGYEQKWVESEGLVVDIDYDLPHVDKEHDDYRRAMEGQGLVVERAYDLLYVDREYDDYINVFQYRSAFQDNEDHIPVYVEQIKPAVKVHEAARALKGNYGIPQMYKNDNKQQELEVDSRKMKGPVMVFHMKPTTQSYDQKWMKSQDLVVGREYDDYRSAIQFRSAFQDDEEQIPVYVEQTKPAVKVHEVARDLEGNYEIPQMYKNYNNQLEFEGDSFLKTKEGFKDDEFLYMTHSKPTPKLFIENLRE